MASSVRGVWPRALALCVIGWLSIGGIYAALIYSQSLGAIGAALSIRVGLEDTPVPSALGLGVWFMTGRNAWPETRIERLFTLHVGCALLFGVVSAGSSLLATYASGRGNMPLAVLYRVIMPWQLAIGVLLYSLIACASYAVRSAMHSRDLRIVAERAERLRAQADLAAIRAHINPHFLFNTLHTVTELLREDPAQAAEALEHLSDLFRYTLDLDRERVELVSLEDEWKFTSSYLWLERNRMGRRLQIDAELDDDALACAVPPFTLQPLIENAVRHGLSPKPAGGTLVVRAHERNGVLSLHVRDDGMGAHADTVTNSAGLGVRSVRQRLEARYAERAVLEVTGAPNQGLAVTISMPAEEMP
ncbi:MAG: sensor histidine kinase [Gemmatimonadaceae bacterium]